MAEEVERPTIGWAPKVIVGGLAVLGLLTLVRWVMSAVFSLAGAIVVVAALVLAGWWVLGRMRRPKREPD